MELAAGYECKVIGAAKYWIGRLKALKLLKRAQSEEFAYKSVTVGQFIKILNHGRDEAVDLTDLKLSGKEVFAGKANMVSAVRARVRGVLAKAHPKQPKPNVTTKKRKCGEDSE